MKRAVMLFVLAAVFFVGCNYEAPLTEEHKVSVDPAVLGLWKPSVAEGEEPEDEQMVILKYSDTEYLIHYPVEDGIYYRVYPIKIGGVSCVQTQAIGTNEGPVEKDTKELFGVVSYKLIDGKLEVKTLNTELVSDKLKDSESLRKEFIKNRDNKELFTNPGIFKRVKGKAKKSGTGGGGK